MNSSVAGADAARSRALAVLRIRGAALAVALLPAAVAVVLLVAGATGRIGGDGWDAVRWAVVAGALAVLVLAFGVAAVIVRARPAVSPTVEVTEEAAPELYRMVRDLAGRLEVPAPSAIALTPDCDSWLEDRSHRSRRRPPRPDGGARAPRPHRRVPDAPVLVIGSPFMWWMRVAELRALLAPVVAGTGPAADPDIAAARRFLRGLDAAVAVAASGRRTGPGHGGPRLRGLARLARRPALAFVGWVARLLLRRCRGHAAEMERAVAAAASERAQAVDYGLRIVAQEQVGLAYAGWDRLLTRVALPAWRMGRWPSQLDAGVVAALTELSRRDRLAEGFETRLGERPACDLLEEPGAIDAAASLLAARLFHGGPNRPGRPWSPVAWESYPEQVVDRIWRSDAARLHRVLDELAPVPDGGPAETAGGPGPAKATLARVLDRLAQGGSDELAARISAHQEREVHDGPGDPAGDPLGAAPAESAAGPADPVPLPVPTSIPAGPVGPEGDPPTPVYQLLPPRTGRELLTDHVTAMVCCAAVDTAGAAPGLDWLDGPTLLVGGVRKADLAWPVLRLVENGDPGPLRAWLATVGVRLETPVRLA
ncbi:integral membrane protein [Streptantibioticus cattleyicolor NRRL 8057 = DSM 46488]|uniref:Integral membrane protein n=1 Tax=Streptantibioticus cattleyicolor (strain ATCC 35852 / DSM 46488 / JCM 4925 / NBRC 14057 / NRRL 8057) TaxID=1003195 RepID=G8WQU4_STREN|nr:integral membrane protein [Streptantibioticus cattleyicolor NRRL 8057 = DSM 46488]